MFGKLMQTMLATSTGAIFPALYLGTLDLLSDPMRLLGALALIVQIGYVSSKTWIVWRDNKVTKNEIDD